MALSARSDGQGPREPLANFTANLAGAAIVNAVGPIRQVVGIDAARNTLIRVWAVEGGLALSLPRKLDVTQGGVVASTECGAHPVGVALITGGDRPGHGEALRAGGCLRLSHWPGAIGT